MDNGNSETNGALQFDIDALGKIKAREMHTLMKPSDLEAVAAVLAKYITACPPEWGDPKSPDTYMDLPFKGETNSLTAVMNAMGDALKNAS